MIYKAYIFDLDGTVLDSMRVWRDIDVEFLGKRGLPFTEEYAKALSSMKLDLAAEYTIKLYGLKEKPNNIIDEWLEMARDAFAERVGLKPYAAELLESLHKKGIPAAVATTSQKSLYLPALKRNGILRFFDAIADSDMVSAGKNSPEIFLRAAALLSRKPEDCIVFEDTAAGVRSAKGAGFTVAAIIEGEREAELDEIRKTADFTAPDFKRFYEELKASKPISALL
ncbi:MAG: HAD family phosphatase [Bacteroides sp.]|nr:HAD family phosphatase [Bacteroides sp.]